MKIITLCGSSKFKLIFRKIEKQLALKGYLVISLSIFAHYDNIYLTEYHKEILDKIHRKKIEISDIILIININRYIGKSTKKEIEYAKKLGKKIIYLVN